MIKASEAYRLTQEAKTNEFNRLCQELLDYLHTYDKQIERRCNQGEFTLRGCIPVDFLAIPSESRQAIVKGYYELFGYTVSFGKTMERYFIVKWDKPVEV